MIEPLNPVKFNRTEKLIARKIYDRDPRFEIGPLDNRLTFKGKDVITGHSAIEDHFSLGAHGREAIFVGAERGSLSERHQYRQIYDRVYRSFQNYAGENLQESTSRAEAFAEAAYSLAVNRMGGLDPRDVMHIDDKLEGALEEGGYKEPDTEVNLAFFIQKSIGVCRHRAALAGYLLERAIKDPALQLGGQVFIDRNSIFFDGYDHAHTWVRWEIGERVIIIDPMIGYLGDLQNADPDEIWDYRREEDLQKLHHPQALPIVKLPHAS